MPLDAADTFFGLPSSRADAVSMGLATYFTGKPCRNGHISPRRVDYNKCVACDREHAAKQRLLAKTCPETLAKRRAAQLAYAKKRLSDPEIRAHVRALESAAYHRSEERRAKKAAADAIRNASEASAISRREAQKARYLRYKSEHPVEYRKVLNPRSYAQRIATPDWVYFFHREEMREIRLACRKLTRDTGVQHHVDHIVPIQHPLVCGLHVPWNLQILTAQDNIAKGNSFLPSQGVAI